MHLRRSFEPQECVDRGDVREASAKSTTKPTTGMPLRDFLRTQGYEYNTDSLGGENAFGIASMRAHS